ncbi:hypothetical protein [Terrimonas pollutisoli]|uniref:hypothetical protein n=1 Tax=Terrimonas pollutisoli TaxID=3034147 RepID=UPI0023EC1DCA|nr:hypothetical protein [Terrimonas sp. H1YJ31]
MNKLMYQSLFFVIIIFFGCKENKSDFDAKSLAREYCACIEEHKKKYDFFDARILCNSKMAINNRFFRLYQGNVMFGNRLSKLPKASADSVLQFSEAFYNYVLENCKSALSEDVNFDLNFPR